MAKLSLTRLTCDRLVGIRGVERPQRTINKFSRGNILHTRERFRWRSPEKSGSCVVTRRGRVCRQDRLDEVSKRHQGTGGNREKRKDREVEELTWTQGRAGLTFTVPRRCLTYRSKSHHQRGNHCRRGKVLLRSHFVLIHGTKGGKEMGGGK